MRFLCYILHCPSQVLPCHVGWYLLCLTHTIMYVRCFSKGYLV